METPESQAIKDMLQGKSCSCPDTIESPSAIWVFADAPDRCPPTAIYVAGLAELGAFFSILQDMRNTIIASKTVGTADEKLRKKSSFYQSYLRRTQSMGVQLDQRIIILFMNAWGKEAVDHFHLGDEMDPELRLTAQAVVDQKVKEICNQEPLKR
uniref:Nucleoprotein n=1 Tax=Jemez Springs virus TaxID=466215 RepID=A0A5B8P9I0_9VIRU|nr:nucleocapsid protein [Jemez Springs virus]